MTGSFDGHANCFIESGDGKGLLIDFNYDTEPLPGTYPLPVRRSADAAQGDPRATTSASSRSAGSTGTSCCPAVRCRCRAHMSMVGKTRRPCTPSSK